MTALGVDGLPLAERVVFRRRNKGLVVEVKPEKLRAAPGEEVRLAVSTRSAGGRPVAAELAVAVVDDAVVAHADDRSADLVAQVLLLPVVGAPLERAGRYLVEGAAGGEALDLLMGTAGYRRFGWLGAGYADDADGDGIGGVIDACPGEPEVVDGVADDDGCPDAPRVWSRRRALPAPRGPARGGAEASRVVVVDAQIRVVETVVFGKGRASIERGSLPLLDEIALVLRAHPEVRRVRVEGHSDDGVSSKRAQALSLARAEAVRKALIQRGVEAGRLVAVGQGASMPRVAPGDGAGQAANRRVELHIVERAGPGELVPARVFPPPPVASGARSDFRETVGWFPLVRTDGQGRASVAVRLSDALTGFRVVAQGVGKGAVGRGEAVVSTARPLGKLRITGGTVSRVSAP
ncbi:MAG: OmpA family protein [bacterium]